MKEEKCFGVRGGGKRERCTYWVHTAYLRFYESGEYFGTYFCILNYTTHDHHMRIFFFGGGEFFLFPILIVQTGVGRFLGSLPGFSFFGPWT